MFRQGLNHQFRLVEEIHGPEEDGMGQALHMPVRGSSGIEGFWVFHPSDPFLTTGADDMSVHWTHNYNAYTV